MREIKFKALSLSNKWIYGDYTNIPEPNIMFYNSENEIDCEPIYYDTLGQFVGLKDIEGKEAYTGDLIPYIFNKKKLGVIVYGEYKNICDDEFASHIGFYVEWQDEDLKCMNRKDLGYWLKLVKIVGNVFENPKLLEENI